MTDNLTAGPNKPGDGTPTGSTQVGADPTAGQTAEPYLHTFLNRDEAEKGWKEQQAALTKAQQEAAEAKRELEMARIARETAEAKAIALGKSQDRSDPAADLEAERERWRKRLREEGEDGVIALAHGVYQSAEAKAEETRKAFEAKLAEIREQLTEVRTTADTFYQANRSEIDALAKEYGLGKQDALRLFRDRIWKAPVAPAAPAPGSPTPAVGRIAETKPTKRQWTEEEKAQMRNMGLSEQEINT